MAAQTRGQLDGTAARPHVLVVGAGPTGLLLAAELQRRDVPCLLIDALDAPRDWDRATIVHSRSMEIFEALGLADRFLERGVQSPAARVHSGGVVLGELRLDLTGSRYGFDLGLSEEVTESLLTSYLEAHGGSVTRSTRLISLAADDNAVTATLESQGVRCDVAAQWIVGCDGLRSGVREAVGIEFRGQDVAEPWAVFDAHIDGWPDEDDVQAGYFDQPPVILTPLPGKRWRVYLRPSSGTSDLVADAGEVVRRYAPDAVFVEVENPVRFHCHARVAERFRSSRVLLAGDAAHASTPAEGHGMNGGLQDAFNLGWKLALVCSGEAGAGLLDTYETERKPVAEQVVSSGTTAEADLALTGESDRADRDAAIRRAFADPDLAHHEAVAAAELDRHYPMSRAVAGNDAAEPSPGVRLPDTAPVKPVGGEPQPLHALTHHRGLTVLVLGGRKGDPRRVANLVAELGRRPSAAIAAVVGLSTRHGDRQVGHIPRSVATQLGVVDVTILVVRPDRYIGLRDDQGDLRAVEAYVNGLLA
jgi:2-polyprenyl-6-methoxyphenol hydroxylase-like FAD-dependent oxidoreductase